MKILLAVSGSIACYKSFELLRILVKKGFEVRVVLTKGALNFLKPDLFRYLGASEVYLPTDDFNTEHTRDLNSRVLHVELANWAEKIIIYPASANTLSNLAFGKCDDLLGSIFLAKKEDTQTIIFPAMNTLMYRHPITKENMNLLLRLDNIGNTFICPPAKGELICKEKGEGKVQDEQVAACLIETISSTKKNKKENVLITTGATIAPIDPVRYVTNPSSGKTGFELAKAFLSLGYDVEVIAGEEATENLDKLNLHPRFSLNRVKTTRDMLHAVSKKIDQADFYISSAAISDLEFTQSQEKLKKANLSESLKFTQAPDILSYVLSNRSNHLKVIGFAAETELNYSTLNEKWQRKKVDLLVGTKVHSGETKESRQGFSVNSCDYFFFKDGNITREIHLNKSELPAYILSEFQ